MRPLSLDELREAISVLPLQTAWDPKKLVNNIRTVLSCCGSLIVVDEEQLTAHFIHPSVQQFLLSGKEDPNNFRFSRQAAELDMARVILTYLHYNVFQKQISTIRVPSVPAQDAPARITAAALGNSSVVRTLALQLLRKRDPGRMDIGKTLSDISGQYQSQTQQRFHFYLYAHEYWLHHAKVLSQDDEPEIHLLKRILSPSMRFTPFDLAHWQSGNTPGLAAALCEQGKFPNAGGVGRALGRGHYALFACNLRSRRYAIQGIARIMPWLRRRCHAGVSSIDLSIDLRARLIQLSGLYEFRAVVRRWLLKPHFNEEECEQLLRPIAGATADGYRIAVVLMKAQNNQSECEEDHDYILLDGDKLCECMVPERFNGLIGRLRDTKHNRVGLHETVHELPGSVPRILVEWPGQRVRPVYGVVRPSRAEELDIKSKRY